MAINTEAEFDFLLHLFKCTVKEFWTFQDMRITAIGSGIWDPIQKVQLEIMKYKNEIQDIIGHYVSLISTHVCS